MTRDEEEVLNIEAHIKALLPESYLESIGANVQAPNHKRELHHRCMRIFDDLADRLRAPAAGAPPALVALVQDWQAKYALMNELAAREEDPSHDQAAENRLHAACRAEEAAHRALLAWSPAPAPVAPPAPEQE